LYDSLLDDQTLSSEATGGAAWQVIDRSNRLARRQAAAAYEQHVGRAAMDLIELDAGLVHRIG